jgi:hypothetical protein
MDNRELILARMLAILEGLRDDGLFAFVGRNDIITAESKLPCALLLDGDETTNESGFGRNRPAHSPHVITMMPEVYILVNGDPAEVGEALNAYRQHVLYALLNDSTLANLVYNNDIRYEGAQSGLALGRSMAGEMGLNISLAYAFKPTIAPAPFPSTEGTEG